ncbi:hypothetical protein HYPSUDRAFT_46968 [Hypholoma sublateritium FD-334 SS-4]|uniref:Cyanovirin-N domain-containing protein n=1 Tax=Hypholoma sublateritium (strain FD-334 SS-4) TaxID=945553 RepID=A0A0D2M0U7_HYPSF|nr:hypothetical protein HYPSUDRAFT_46968 [Hypholoma sublateritium FD-334 SS-4]
MKNYILLSLSLLFAVFGVNASSYSIQLFSDSNCEDLLAEDSGTFSSNGCITQSGVNSIRITNLDNAMIHTWAHGQCDHNEWTVPVGCPGGNSCIKAPGTESFGFQVGCI